MTDTPTEPTEPEPEPEPEEVTEGDATVDISGMGRDPDAD
jgi:hypothetical protein